MGHKASVGYSSEKIREHIGAMATTCTPHSVEQAIKDLIVDSSLPVSIVESQRFRNLVERLNFSASAWIPTRKKMMESLTQDLTNLHDLPQ